MKKNKKVIGIIVALAILLVAIIMVGNHQDRMNLARASQKNLQSEWQQSKISTVKSSEASSELQSSKTSSSSSVKSDLPNAHQSDWDLVLVNRNHPKDEMNPQLATVDDKKVDARIATAVTSFLAAARRIDSAEHLISGYRSVDYQAQLYEMYIDEEMEGDGTVNNSGNTISRDQAVKDVNTYSQPPKMSEHETGLAIDMSTVDSLDSCDSSIVEKVAALAPQYGFVLRFEKDKQASTGVGYEDWHYRYVGVENAKYMTAHHLSLEEYVALLPK